MSWRPLSVLCLAVTMVGCGAGRVEPPRLDRPVEPKGEEAYRSDTGDVRFRYPANWALVEGDAPAVAHLLSGPAVLTVWSYRRRAVPTTRSQARVARRRLVAEVKRRDSSFVLEESRVTRHDGVYAVEVRGRATIGARRVQLRSRHIYEGRGEYVIDAYVPPRHAAIPLRVFESVMSTVQVGGRPETR